MILKRIVIVAMVLAAQSLPAASVSAATPRTSLTAVETDVMCVSCREPLALAQSPQAIAERSYISQLIAQGETKAQIEKALVGQYGPAVLGKPPAHGFNLAVYVIPPALLLTGIVTLFIVLPRWRRRAAAGSRTPATALAASDARRLDDELAHFDG